MQQLCLATSIITTAVTIPLLFVLLVSYTNNNKCHGQNVAVLESESFTPLATAIQNDDLEGVTQMLTAANDTVDIVNEAIGDTNGTTPLQLAVKMGNEKIMKLLLETGAHVNAQDANGWTALHHLAIRGIGRQKALMVHLFVSGADPNIKNNAGETPVDLMPEAHELKLLTAVLGSPTPRENVEFVKNLTDFAETVVTDWSRAMLEFTIEKNERINEFALGHLVAMGIDKTLLFAIMLNKPTVVQMLLQYGYVNGSEPLQQIEPPEWPLHVAAQFGQAQIVSLLLAQPGLDVNVQDVDGWTPLHYLAFNYRPNESTPILKVLLGAGADPTIKTKDGKLPVDLAKERGKADAEFMELLKQGGKQQEKEK